MIVAPGDLAAAQWVAGAEGGEGGIDETVRQVFVAPFGMPSRAAWITWLGRSPTSSTNSRCGSKRCASHSGTFSPMALHSRVWPAHRRPISRGRPWLSGFRLCIRSSAVWSLMRSSQGWPDLISTALPGPPALKFSESPPRA